MGYAGELVETLEDNKKYRRQICDKVGFFLKKEGIEKALKVIEDRYTIRSKKQK
jgi:hypothetical protein